MKLKTALTIAGSDCSGGAGIQADLKTFSAHGLYGMSVITSVVAENTNRVISLWDVPPHIISAQIDAIFEDIVVDGVKIGMLSEPQTLISVAESLEKYRPKNVVTDTVIQSKDGTYLLQPQSIELLKERIIPLSSLITPNIPEAEIISGIKINSESDLKKAAEKIYSMGSSVLIKGGHAEGEPADYLFDGKKFHVFTTKRINTKNTHGTGCTLSSAITSNLAKGLTLAESVKNAKEYITTAIKYSLEIGKGNGPTNHFHNLYYSYFEDYRISQKEQKND